MTFENLNEFLVVQSIVSRSIVGLFHVALIVFFVLFLHGTSLRAIGNRTMIVALDKT